MRKMVLIVVSLLFVCIGVEVGGFDAHAAVAWTTVLSAVAVMPAIGGAFTIKDFCARHGISVPFYYSLRKLGEGPTEMIVGARVLVSYEAAEEWRREREKVAAASTKERAAISERTAKARAIGVEKQKRPAKT